MVGGGGRLEDGGAQARDEHAGLLALRQQRALHGRQHHLRPAAPRTTTKPGQDMALAPLSPRQQHGPYVVR